MTTTAKTKRDRNGFPLVPCHRCLGTGRLGPRTVAGGLCSTCRGWAWFYPTSEVREIANDYEVACDRVLNPLGTELQPGEVVRGHLGGDWKTVTRVRIGNRVIRQMKFGVEGQPGFEHVCDFEAWVEFDDGTEADAWQLFTREDPDYPDPAPYLARLPKKWRP